MLVLSSPSAAGKSSIAQRLLAQDSGLELSVSVTTRPARPSERDGQDYHFIDAAQFTALEAEAALLESATVFGNQYGTLAAPVEAALAAGRDVLFDIDWQGAQQLAAKARDDLVRVFILPPSFAELARRLKTRASEPAQAVAHRLSKAADEISHWLEYDYVIINESLDRSVDQVQNIVNAERLRRTRRTGLLEFVTQLRNDAAAASQSKLTKAH